MGHAAGARIEWVGRARFVEDGKVWTSSGVSAGIDMALAVIARLLGYDAADTAATRMEYVWEQDPGADPFAARYGLGDGP